MRSLVSHTVLTSRSSLCGAGHWPQSDGCMIVVKVPNLWSAKRFSFFKYGSNSRPWRTANLILWTNKQPRWSVREGELLFEAMNPFTSSELGRSYHGILPASYGLLVYGWSCRQRSRFYPPSLPHFAWLSLMYGRCFTVHGSCFSGSFGNVLAVHAAQPA